MKSVSDSIENSPTSTNNEVNENPSTSSLNRNKEAFVSKIKEYEKLFSDRYNLMLKFRYTIKKILDIQLKIQSISKE